MQEEKLTTLPDDSVSVVQLMHALLSRNEYFDAVIFDVIIEGTQNRLLHYSGEYGSLKYSN